MHTWRELIDKGDAETLAELAGKELGLILPPKPFLAECRVAKSDIERGKNKLGDSDRSGLEWSDCTWKGWLKNRAETIGCYTVIGPTDQQINWSSCTFHVGFLFIEETEEHLDKLKRVVEPEEKESTARSKIGSTARIVRPIDRVADRVAPDTEKWNER